MTPRGSVPPSEDGFTGLAAAWLFTHRSWNTRSAYDADLAGFAAWCAQTGRQPLHATRSDIEVYRSNVEATGASPALVRRRLAALTSFFRYASDDDAENPAEGVDRPATAAASSTAELTDREAEAFAAAAPALGAKADALVSLLLLDGLKLGEALGVDVEDVSTPPPVLTIDRQGRPQAISLHATTAAALAMCVGGRAAGPLFIGASRRGAQNRLTRSGADYLIKRVTADSGIGKAVSANTLRRHYAKTAHAQGAPLDEIRARLGHYDRRTTNRLLPKSAQNDQKEETHAHSIRPIP